MVVEEIGEVVPPEQALAVDRGGVEECGGECADDILVCGEDAEGALVCGLEIC